MVVAVISCTQKEKSPVAENYLPETPKLSSDIMTPEVLWSFGRVVGTQVSPDGKTAVYTVNWVNMEKNKSFRDIYSIPVEGGEPVNLTNTPENEGEIKWCPDGKKIGYLSSVSGSSQMWEMNPDGSGKKQVTDVEGGIFGFDYAPDLSKIYFLKTMKLDKDIHDLFPDLPKANARLENDIMYRH